MHRSTILLMLCAAAVSACVVTTKKEPVVRDHRTPREEPPPPPPPEPEVRDHRTPREEPPPPPPPVVRDHRTPEEEQPWARRGWTLLGEQWVTGGRDKDFIRVGSREGGFTKLMLVVEGSDVLVNNIIIEYDNGRKFSPPMKKTFKEGSRSAPIDLQGKSRVIKEVELRYRNLPGGGRAKVQLWGRRG
jgi:hypothetical protein